MKKKVLVPKYTKRSSYTKVVSVICDICKDESPDDEWTEDSYHFATTEVNLSKTSSYYGEGSREDFSYDICPKCFENELMPWLKSKGAEPTVEETDW